MNQELQKKLSLLESNISKYNSALIAFSGGVDSVLLAYICKNVFDNNALLITASSSTYPKRELNDAIKFAKQISLEHIVINSEELEIPQFSQNPPDRCYHCKRELFSKLKVIAGNKGLDAVFDGNNASDLSDYRPGHIAAKELGIISPFEDAGFTKDDIRELSRQYNLPTAEKPAMACLSSRFPYGENITKEKLERVENAENFLYEQGYSQFRVRSHENLARIEFIELEIDRAFAERASIQSHLRSFGFTYCCIDMQGYRTGAMNEVLPSFDKQ